MRAWNYSIRVKMLPTSVTYEYGKHRRYAHSLKHSLSTSNRRFVLENGIRDLLNL